MRIHRLIVSDIRFQVKYGFYFIYAVLCALYLTLLFMIPEQWREKAAALTIFSDPAAMGMFFMGAVVLLEKSERVLDALAVSPIRIWEYILSKAAAFVFISVIVAAILAIASGLKNIPVVLAGTALSSVIFTLLGLIVGAGVKSLNRFIIATVPFELICFVPAVLYAAGYQEGFMRWYPPNICMALLLNQSRAVLLDIFILIAFTILLYIPAYRMTLKMRRSAGGVKL